MTTGVELLSAEARADVQGFITTGYGHLPVACYLFVRLTEPEAARRWLASMAADVTSAAPWPKDGDGSKIKPTSALNVGLTADGLRACGLPERVLCTFPSEFREGIAAPARSRILGDTEESAPSEWDIGGPRTETIHAVVLLHAASSAILDDVCGRERDRIRRTGGAVVEAAGSAQSGYRPKDDVEPFGFRDGIAQPSILGITGRGLPTGEFILGYPNHYGVIPPSPVVPDELDPRGLLPACDNPYFRDAGLRDLGRHGSFVAYRKLQQDVPAFRRFLRDESLRARGREDAGFMTWLASKMVGRWPSGAPLVLAPEADDPSLGASDAFEYGDDQDGLRCPIGAHIRRSRPRDDLKPYPAEQSRHMSDAHRLLRRARVYGPEPTGIHFFSVNASLRSQFEFVQQTWCNNPSAGGLYESKDPIAGDNERAGEPPSRMIVPRSGSPLRTGPLPRFVTVRGGAYLFMPGLRALRYLGQRPTAG